MKVSQTSSLHTHSPSSVSLSQLGWTPFFQQQLEAVDAGATVARVVGIRKKFFFVSRGNQEQRVTLAGALVKDRAALYPAVGDWVLLRDSVIFAILPRQNALTRKASGGKKSKKSGSASQDQVIVVNVDKVYIVCGLDRDFNSRRIERYLTMVYNCSMTPEIILTKADLHEDPESCVDQVESVAFGVPVHLVSAADEETITALRSELATGITVTLIGSSGAGKSTLINRVYGDEIQATGSVSDSLGKGKHTTTSRDLILLPTGGMIIDNPGVREIALGAASDDSSSAFPEIEELARACKFQDCTHIHEPGCQVREAVASGTLAPERLHSYHKISNELHYAGLREQKSAARVERERWKGVAKQIKSIKKGS